MESTYVSNAYIEGYCQKNGIEIDTSMDLIEFAKKQNIPKLHCFKNTSTPRLERVTRLFKLLKGYNYRCRNIVDFGSQRGALLWPTMVNFPGYSYTAIDLDKKITDYLQCVVDGGCTNLTVINGDITKKLPLEDSSADIVVASEILEHLEEPEKAAQEAVRLAKYAVYVTVPSKPDDNPEHIQLFTPDTLKKLFSTNNKVESVKTEYIKNCIVCIVTLKDA